MDWSTIKHVCGSEKTARKRFKDLKIEMLQVQLEMIMFSINEYIKNTYEETDLTLEFELKQIEKNIKTLTECTFEHRIRVMVDQPTCAIHELEP